MFARPVRLTAKLVVDRSALASLNTAQRIRLQIDQARLASDLARARAQILKVTGSPYLINITGTADLAAMRKELDRLRAQIQNMPNVNVGGTGPGTGPSGRAGANPVAPGGYFGGAGGRFAMGAGAASWMGGGTGTTLGAGFGAMAGGVPGAVIGGGIGKGVDSAANFVAGGIDSLAQTQRIEQMLRAILKDDKAGSELLDAVRALQKEAPQLTKLSLAQSAGALAGANIDPKKIPDMVRVIAEAAATSTLPVEEAMERLTRALYQMQTNGKLSAEEANQASELGIPLRQIISEQFGGRKFDDIAKDSQAGKIDIEDVMDRIFAGLDKRYTGSLARQMETLPGQLAALNAAMLKLKETAAEPLIQPLTEAISKLNVAATAGDFDALAESLAEASTQAVNLTIGVAKMYTDWKEYMDEVFNGDPSGDLDRNLNSQPIVRTADSKPLNEPQAIAEGLVIRFDELPTSTDDVKDEKTKAYLKSIETRQQFGQPVTEQEAADLQRFMSAKRYPEQIPDRFDRPVVTYVEPPTPAPADVVAEFGSPAAASASAQTEMETFDTKPVTATETNVDAVTDAADELAASLESLASDVQAIDMTTGPAQPSTGAIEGAFANVPQFESGGFTGNTGTSTAAGIVHGKEFVVNAEGTKKYREVLEAMNSGAEIPGFKDSDDPQIGSQVTPEPINIPAPKILVSKQAPETLPAASDSEQITSEIIRKITSPVIDNRSPVIDKRSDSEKREDDQAAAEFRYAEQAAKFASEITEDPSYSLEQVNTAKSYSDGRRRFAGAKLAMTPDATFTGEARLKEQQRLQNELTDDSAEEAYAKRQSLLASAPLSDQGNLPTATTANADVDEVADAASKLAVTLEALSSDVRAIDVSSNTNESADSSPAASGPSDEQQSGQAGNADSSETLATITEPRFEPTPMESPASQAEAAFDAEQAMQTVDNRTADERAFDEKAYASRESKRQLAAKRRAEAESLESDPDADPIQIKAARYAADAADYNATLEDRMTPSPVFTGEARTNERKRLAFNEFALAKENRRTNSRMVQEATPDEREQIGWYTNYEGASSLAFPTTIEEATDDAPMRQPWEYADTIRDQELAASGVDTAVPPKPKSDPMPRVERMRQTAKKMGEIDSQWFVSADDASEAEKLATQFKDDKSLLEGELTNSDVDLEQLTREIYIDYTDSFRRRGETAKSTDMFAVLGGTVALADKNKRAKRNEAKKPKAAPEPQPAPQPESTQTAENNPAEASTPAEQATPEALQVTPEPYAQPEAETPVSLADQFPDATLASTEAKTEQIAPIAPKPPRPKPAIDNRTETERQFDERSADDEQQRNEFEASRLRGELEVLKRDPNATAEQIGGAEYALAAVEDQLAVRENLTPSPELTGDARVQEQKRLAAKEVNRQASLRERNTEMLSEASPELQAEIARQMPEGTTTFPRTVEESAKAAEFAPSVPAITAELADDQQRLAETTAAENEARRVKEEADKAAQRAEQRAAEQAEQRATVTAAETKAVELRRAAEEEKDPIQKKAKEYAASAAEFDAEQARNMILPEGLSAEAEITEKAKREAENTRRFGERTVENTRMVGMASEEEQKAIAEQEISSPAFPTAATPEDFYNAEMQRNRLNTQADEIEKRGEGDLYEANRDKGDAEFKRLETSMPEALKQAAKDASQGDAKIESELLKLPATITQEVDDQGNVNNKIALARPDIDRRPSIQTSGVADFNRLMQANVENAQMQENKELVAAAERAEKILNKTKSVMAKIEGNTRPPLKITAVAG
jgi:tape measure domain-containing protein